MAVGVVFGACLPGFESQPCRSWHHDTYLNTAFLIKQAIALGILTANNPDTLWGGRLEVAEGK